MVVDIHSFTELMRLAECDEFGNFWHADGAVSAAWLTHPAACEHLSGNQRHGKADEFGKAVGALPPGSTVQCIYRNSRYLDWALSNYLNAGQSTHPWLRQYELAKCNAYREWSKTLKEVVGEDVNAKDQQCLVVITIYQPMENAVVQAYEDIRDSLFAPDPELKDLPPLKATKAHQRTLDRVQRMYATITSFRRVFSTMFRTIAVPAINCSLETMVRFTRCQIDPVQAQSGAVIVDDERLIPEMVCGERVEFRNEGKYVYCNGSYSAVMSLEKYPDNCYAGVLSLNNQDLVNEPSPLDFIGDGVLCVSCKVVERNDAMGWLQDRERRTKGKSNEAVSANKAYGEVMQMKDWVLNLDRKLVDMTITLKVVAERQDELDLKCNELAGMFRTIRYGFQVEQTDVKTVWCEQLPGGFNSDSNDGSLRVKRKRDIVFGAMAPIYGSGRGSRLFVHMAFNEHYEPHAFNSMDARSFNVGYFGEPGAGKSNKIASVIRDGLRHDQSKAFIIDYGGSFTSLVTLADKQGLEVPVTMGMQQPDNPFAGPEDVTIPILMNWIPNLALNPDEFLDPVVASKMADTLRKTFRLSLKRNQPYNTFAEIAQRYRDFYPTNARKRVQLHPVPSVVMDAVREQLKGDPERIPRYKVFYVARLKSFKQDHGDRREVRSVRDIGAADQEMLESRFSYLEEDADGPYVLIQELINLEALAARNWQVEVDDRFMIAECQRDEDLTALLRTGVQLKFPSEYLAIRRAAIRETLVKRFGAENPMVERRLFDEMQAIDPLEYFAGLTGMVDLQDEVVFSQWIEQTRLLNDPGLNDFVARLSMWYGDGIYAETFDRRGGPDLKDFRVVYWDFKPIFNSDVRFLKARIGTVLLRIQVYCNSVTTMSERKYVVLDEYQEFKRKCGPMITQFVDSTLLQARKNKYGLHLGTQKFDHIIDSGVPGINLIDQFQHYWVGTQLPASYDKMQDAFQLTDEQMYVAAKARVEPGQWSQFLLYIPSKGVFDLVREVKMGFDIWMDSTSGEERERRNDTVKKYTDQGRTATESLILACIELSRNYPRGLIQSQTVEIT